MMKRAVLMAGLLMLVAGRVFSQVETDKPMVNPHTEEGNCTICHVASEEDLRSWFSFSATKKKMKMNLVEMCQQCHGTLFGHGVGKIPKMNREGLPLDSDGRIACAITCHDMHGDRKETRKMLRFPDNRLCLSCHRG